MKRALTPEAEAELTDAALWYEDRHEGLAVEFIEEAEEVFRTIEERLPGCGARNPPAPGTHFSRRERDVLPDQPPNAPGSRGAEPTWLLSAQQELAGENLELIFYRAPPSALQLRLRFHW